MDPQSSECQRTFQPLAAEVKIRCKMHQQYINIPSRHIPAPVQPRHGRSRCSWCWGYPYTFVWWRDVSRVEIMFFWLWPLIQSIDAQSSRKSECFSLSCTVMWNHAVVSLQSVSVLIALRTSSDTIFKCCWHVHSTWLSWSRTHDEHTVFPGWISCAPKLGEETKSGPSLFPEFLRVSCLNCLKKGLPIPCLPWFGRSFPCPRSARTVRIRCQRRCTWGITSWGQTPASIALENSPFYRGSTWIHHDSPIKQGDFQQLCSLPEANSISPWDDYPSIWVGSVWSISPGIATFLIWICWAGQMPITQRSGSGVRRIWICFTSWDERNSQIAASGRAVSSSHKRIIHIIHFKACFGHLSWNMSLAQNLFAQLDG